METRIKKMQDNVYRFFDPRYYRHKKTERVIFLLIFVCVFAYTYPRSFSLNLALIKRRASPHLSSL